ncbi:hypothetical protein EVAR_85095_1 [Eumeta japonica]|uniref:Uncharacterized protein n=1 Tax=Eumeta variegata TaxID=151549 RepID=A0A4C1XRP0_EUMVA|nr:hypothetical protein EVAR_85095_1 [Eumeta japonica]
MRVVLAPCLNALTLNWEVSSLILAANELSNELLSQIKPSYFGQQIKPLVSDAWSGFGRGLVGAFSFEKAGSTLKLLNGHPRFRKLAAVGRSPATTGATTICE